MRDAEYIRRNTLRYCALRGLGFEEPTRGSHHIFHKPGVEELINLQRDGNKAKAYRVRQARTVITQYKLGGND